MKIRETIKKHSKFTEEEFKTLLGFLDNEEEITAVDIIMDGFIVTTEKVLRDDTYD